MTNSNQYVHAAYRDKLERRYPWIRNREPQPNERSLATAARELAQAGVYLALGHMQLLVARTALTILNHEQTRSTSA